MGIIAEKTVTYIAAPGSHINNAQAQRYGEVLETLAEELGGITEEDVLQRAKGTPLEEYFEWEDDVAASKFRKSQAGDLLRWICKEVTINERPQVVRAFYPVTVSEKPSEPRRYEPVSVVFSTVEYKNEVIKDALIQLNAWRNKFEIYTELSELVAKVGDLVEEYGAKHNIKLGKKK